MDQGEEAGDGRAPRVFLKIGANHGMRGHSFTNVPALGNFLSQRGLSRGDDMVNVFIACFGGQQNNPQTGENGACDSSEVSAESPLRTQLLEGPMTLFDLRPLRRVADRFDPQTRRIVLGYDFYLVVRDPAPATPLTR